MTDLDIEVLLVKPNGKTKKATAYLISKELAIIGFKIKDCYYEYDYIMSTHKWSNDFTDDLDVYETIKDWKVQL